MKKFFLLAMAAVAMTFTACKNEPAAPAPTDEPETPEVVEITTDSIAKVIEAGDSTQLGTLLTTIQEQIETLKGTDVAKAKTYLETVQTFLKENADKIKAVVGTGTIASLVDAVNNLPAIEVPDVAGAAADAVEGAADAAADAAQGAVDAAQDAAQGAADAVQGAADAAQDAAQGAADAAKGAAADAVQGAADAAKGALK